jgi:signal transduction histidine kinase
VKENISKAEERIFKLINQSQVHLDEDQLTEAAGRIQESEFLVSEIFSVNSDGKIIFPLFKPLYILDKETENKRAFSVAIEGHQDFKLAETAEFKTKNYSLAIRHYRQLLSSTSDQASRALLLNRIARCTMISGNPERAVDIYYRILGEYKDEYSPDGIPYAVIALYQIGTLYASVDEQLKSMKALLELYDGLLESRWSLSQAQFQFYLKTVNDELARVRSEIEEEETRKAFAERWHELNQIEEIKLERMSTIEDIAYKIIPLIETSKTASGGSSGSFSHISQSGAEKAQLASYTFLEGDSIFGFTVDQEYVKKDILVPILEKISSREDFFIQIRDDEKNAVAGKDISRLDGPFPQISYSRAFEESFPPWTIEIFQTFPNEAEREFNLRRNIYISLVFVVIVSLLFGGILAIRSTAKELKLARLKSDFVSTVSHEFRTPLTSIRYLADLLQRGRVKKEDRKQQYYETITQESERLSRLIENTLDFSKIEAGVKEYEFAEMDAAEMCRDVVRRFQGQVAPQEFTIESDISEELPQIFADREALSRALFNLLDNAVKYSGDSRRISMRTWSDESNISIEVEDKGVGIASEEQQRVFEKFYRSGDIQESNVKGSGIGLTIVEHVVKAHGGKVFLESGIGEGTKVTLQLPKQHKSA